MRTVTCPNCFDDLWTECPSCDAPSCVHGVPGHGQDCADCTRDLERELEELAANDATVRAAGESLDQVSRQVLATPGAGEEEP